MKEELKNNIKIALSKFKISGFIPIIIGASVEYMLNKTFIYTAGLTLSISVLKRHLESRKDQAITKMHNSKDNSSKMEPNKNTCLPKWTDIPESVQQYILEFLPPSIALEKMITLSKNNLDLHGEDIIHRLQNEKFKCKSIQIGDLYNLALYQDGSLCLGI